MIKQLFRLAFSLCLLMPPVAAWAGSDLTELTPDGSQYTGFSNVGSILNSRHNLTQSTLDPSLAGGAGNMAPYRNDYGQVCVYCHTPHGANVSAPAPLWNRNMPPTTYTTYDKLGTSTLTQTVYQPGAASLPCLSCHSDPGNSASAVDLSIVAIGTDLRNDHPVGVKFPAVTGDGTDWKTPTGVKSSGVLTTRFFDEDSNGRMDKNDIRLYDTGNGPSVECASCHDPHGVPGVGGTFNPTFLRKSNSQSAVCLTCHSK